LTSSVRKKTGSPSPPEQLQKVVAMNPCVDARPTAGIQGSSLTTVPELLKQLPVSYVEPELLLQFSQEFELFQFELGELILNYISDRPESSVPHEPGWTDLFIVCQGRVRLLAFDPERQRLVSVKSLEIGEIFGADEVFSQTPLPYQAIAAASAQVARLSCTKIQPWLHQIPDLRDFLEQQTRQREHLIFFKTCTPLRSLPSSQLQRLLPLLAEVRIAAGERFVDVPVGQTHYCWLRHGQIASLDNGAQPPQSGDSWGYPELIPANWMAATELTVYTLPEEHWQAATAIAPLLLDASPAAVSPLSNSAAGRVGVRGGKGPQSNFPATLPRPSQPPAIAPLTCQGDDDAQLLLDASEIQFPEPTRRRSRRRLWPTYPLIEQQSTSDCGVACLAMIGQYWGQRLSLNNLRNLAQVGRAGASLKNLAGAAERVGFQARPVRASLGRLVELGQPWVAHWQGDHYVVVYRTQGDRILIADPARGKRTLSQAEFLENWTGYALLLSPTDALKAQKTAEGQSLWRFWKLLLPYQSILWQIILASLLIQVFGLITPLFTQVILDQVVVQKSLPMLHVFALGLIIFSIWRVGITGVRQYLLDYFSNRLDLTLVSGFISHALTLPLKFFESRQVGDIVTRIQENQKIQRFLVRQAISTWLDTLMAVVYLGLMLYYNWRLTLLVLALIPPIVVLTLAATPLLKRVSREIFNETAEQNSLVVEMMTGLATVKSAAVEQEVRWRWEDRLVGMLNAQFKGQKLANGLQVSSGLINAIGGALLLWYGATLVIQEQLTIGQFVAFNMLIGSVIDPILNLVGVWDELQEVLISVERLNDVFSAQPEERPGHPMLVMPPIQGEVRFEDVTFTYDSSEERNTLQNLSFHIQSGQTIALVGRSGSGKSTLVKLLQGLYHPTRGRILIDDHDIRHVSPCSLRSQLGVVPQECFLFSGTILENIQLYRTDFSLEQVIEVAKLAEAHGFIQDLPLGYNTKVGERGSNLSGGQRQRIAIARALLGNPAILILDEATSSLDTESERRFQQNLSRISCDRTTFIIAHRLSTVQHADHILVLDRGVLVEHGTHEQLIAERGLYCHLAHQQLNL
jgi:HlyB family type I secretion system ABC transporter